MSYIRLHSFKVRWHTPVSHSMAKKHTISPHWYECRQVAVTAVHLNLLCIRCHKSWTCLYCIDICLQASLAQSALWYGLTLFTVIEPMKETYLHSLVCLSLRILSEWKPHRRAQSVFCSKRNAVIAVPPLACRDALRLSQHSLIAEDVAITPIWND